MKACLAYLPNLSAVKLVFQVVVHIAYLQTLRGIPDQDLFYDVTDALEEQGMEAVIVRLMNREGVDPDLLEQLRIYEVVLQHEDEEADAAALSDAVDNIR